MIYLHASCTGHDDWSVIGRAYATALWGAGLPARLVWPERTALVPEDLWPERGDRAGQHPVVQLACAAPEKSSVLIRIGEPKTLLAADDRAPVNIAVVWFRGQTPKPRILRRLGQRFSEVWCLDRADMVVLQGAGVSAYHVPYPSYDSGGPRGSDRALLWGPWEEIESTARKALSEPGPRLVIVSEECPFRYADEVEEWLGSAPARPLTVRRAPRTDAERLSLRGACGTRLPVERPGGPILADLEAREYHSFAWTAGRMRERLIAQRSIAFVVPHKDRGASELSLTLASLEGQLLPDDEVLISDQGSKVAVGALGVRVVRDPAPPEVWNIARARNLGLEGVQARHVMFLDADCELPPGFVAEARKWLAVHPYEGLAPMVKGRDNPGTGIAILPVAAVREAGGYDEDFEGYGSEDIELLWRLRAQGVEVRPWTDGPLVVHRDHPLSPLREEYGKKNLYLLQEKRCHS